ncbi:MAG: rare lipoprotein [Bacteroidetes bacterium]|nr:rare lipoprotein [Bacteroidota bacterium]
MTAAHKTLAFGTKVRVTNFRNDKSVIVTINDRLPKQSKRSIDLSQCAAEELDFIKAGITKVSIQIIPDSIKTE